jgi:hypothetical protein
VNTSSVFNRFARTGISGGRVAWLGLGHAGGPSPFDVMLVRAGSRPCNQAGIDTSYRAFDFGRVMTA